MDCGVHALLAAFIWLLYPSPLSYKWSDLVTPGIAAAMRPFIANCLHTGTVPNTLLHPTFQPTHPTPPFTTQKRTRTKENKRNNASHIRRGQRRRAARKQQPLNRPEPMEIDKSTHDP